MDNSTKTNDEEDNLSAGEIISVMLMIIVDLGAVIGNLLVITIIAKTPQLRNLTHLFVLNLCILDLLCAFIVMPVSIVSSITLEWRFGEAYCKANGFFNAFFAFSSILTLCVISVERYYSIAHPMDHAANMTPTKALVSITYIWLQSGLLALPPLLGLNSYEYNQHRGHCTFVWEHSATHIAYVALIGTVCFLLPAGILVVTYGNVFRVARQAARQITPSYTFGSYGSTSPRCNVVPREDNVTPLRKGGSPDTTGNKSSGPCTRHQNNRQQNYVDETKKKRFLPKAFFSITSSDIKAAKTILFIVSMFLFLWTPYFVLHIYGVVNESPNVSMLFWERFTTWVAYTSSAVNPILYGVLNRQIREEMTDMFALWWQRLKCYRRGRTHSTVDDGGPAGAEDFFQFLERTSMFTKSTSVTSGLNGKTENCKVEQDIVPRIPGQIPELSEDDRTE